MSKRPAMLGSAIREIIAPVLHDCPHACGIVAISGIEVSIDLSYATVTISAMKEPERALKFLHARTPGLQRQLGKLHSRIIPQLRFRTDATEEKATRVDQLLERLAAEEEAKAVREKKTKVD